MGLVFPPARAGMGGQGRAGVAAGEGCVPAPLCPAIQKGKASCRNPPASQVCAAGCGLFLLLLLLPDEDNAPGSCRASQGRAAAPGAPGARSVDGQELSPAPCGGLRHSSALSGNENIPNRIRAALGKGATREHPQPTKGIDDGFGGGGGCHNTGNDPQLQPLTVGVEPLTN